MDGNGGRLIAAPSFSKGIAKWGCYYYWISEADVIAIGTGSQNTIDIQAGCTVSLNARPPYHDADICANLTLGGYSDWF